MILFRTDASLETGYGRLIRSLNLALHLKGKNRILFAVNDDATAAKLLGSRHLPCQSPEKIDPGQLTDLRLVIFDTAARLAEEDQLETFRQRQVPILQIKESSSETSFGNWVVDLSLPPPEAHRESIFSGPGWLPLHTRFRHFRSVPRKYKKQVHHLFLFLGGAPGYRCVRHLVDILHRHSFHVRIAADFLLGKAERKGLKRLIPALRFVGKVECLGRPLFEADLALVTPGSVALEAAACGTPALYLFRNDIQRQSAEWLQQKGAGINLGSLDDVNETTLVCALKSLDKEKREGMGMAAKQLGDARGLFRVVNLLQEKKIIT